MQQIDTWPALACAIDDPLLTSIRPLLAARQDQLADYADELSDLAIITIVQEGDSLAAIEAQLGFPLATNMVDGVRLGEPNFSPSWEYAERHPSGWTEIVFVLSDDGFGHVILVPEGAGFDPALTQLCALADKSAAPAAQAITH